MAIRRSDTRRRRVGVLIDDHTVASVDPPASDGSVSSSEEIADKSASEYSISARRRHLAKTTDLIPKRAIAVTLLVLALVVGVGVINLLYFYSGQMVEVLGERAREVFSFTEQGSLAQWFSTTLLMLGGMASLQVYALRRHRSDDYVGAYKLWFWIALLLLFASLNSAVGLHQLAVHAAGTLIGSQMAPGGWGFVGLTIAGILLVATRMIVEVRQSRVATAGVVLVSLAFCSATLIHIPEIKSPLGSAVEPAYGNLLVVGNAILLLTVFLYARFVYFRAQGILARQHAATQKVSATKKKSTKKKAASKRSKRSAEKSEVRVNSSHEVKNEKSTRKSKTKSSSSTSKPAPSRAPKLTLQTRESSKTSSNNEDSQSESESQQDSIESLPLGGKLSKSKARKLRKQKKQQRRAA